VTFRFDALRLVERRIERRFFQHLALARRGITSASVNLRD
jgi:hypothetical protein